MKWLDNIRRRHRSKKFIRNFIANPSNSIILKQWEHIGWGDALYINGSEIHGHLSGLRTPGWYVRYCDLRNCDVIVFKSQNIAQSDGKKYVIGLFREVEIQRDPPDMFFAKYFHLGFADDYNIDTIIDLAEERIKHL